MERAESATKAQQVILREEDTGLANRNIRFISGRVRDPMVQKMKLGLLDLVCCWLCSFMLSIVVVGGPADEVVSRLVVDRLVLARWSLRASFIPWIYERNP